MKKIMVGFAIIVIAICLLSGSASAGYYGYGGYGYGGAVADNVQGHYGGWGAFIKDYGQSEPGAVAKHIHGLLGFGFGW